MKIIQFSIPRLKDRQDRQREGLLTQGVPDSQIEVFNGVDGMDYKKTIDIFNAIVNDGFSHYQTYIDRYYDDWMSANLVAQMWSYLQLFRNIIKSGDTCLVTHDDMIFLQGYQHYLDIKEHAEEVARRENTSLKYIALHHTHDDKEMWMRPVPIPPEKILIRGIISMGADVAFIITPEGAQWLLENWTIPGMHAILECAFEVFMTEMKSLDEAFEITGIYSTLNIGNVRPNTDIKSALFADTPEGRAGKEYIRPLSETGRN